MKVISEKHFTENLSATLDQINDKSIPIIISRKTKPSIVIMPIFAYDAIEKLFEIIGEDADNLYKLYLKSGRSSDLDGKDF
jgi:prevent-host-death family protein